MIKSLVVVVSGGALAFGLAGAASPAMAWGSVRPAGVTQAKLLMPGPPPIIRDSTARLGDPDDGGQVTAAAKLLMPGPPPLIRRSTARPSGAGGAKLMAPSDPPIIRGSTARLGDPDDGGQVTAALGDPDDGGE